MRKEHRVNIAATDDVKRVLDLLLLFLLRPDTN